MVQPYRNCPSCNKAVVRKAGLYRCECGKSFEGDGLSYREPTERRSDTYSDPQPGIMPIDGRAVPLTRRIK